MENKSKNKQDVKLSTESVMTNIPIYDNPVLRVAKASREQIMNGTIDKPISAVHKSYDTDLARDNLENDIPNADLQDL